MKLKILALLLCGAIASSGVQAMDVDRDELLMQQYLRLQLDGGDQEARDFFFNRLSRSANQMSVSALRFPLAVAANFLKVKNRKVGYLLSAFTNIVRLTDNTLSIRNSGLNKYNAFLVGYDLIRCGNDLVTAFRNDATESDVQIAMISRVRKVLLPFVEACCAYSAASPIYPTKTQEFFQSISTFAQLLSDYLDSPSNSTESKLLLACLIVNVGCAGYDLTKIFAWWTELQRRAQEQQNRLNRQEDPRDWNGEGDRVRPQVQPVLNAHVVGEGENAQVILQREQGVDIQSNASCPICRNDYEVQDELAVFPCNHSYCTGCFDRGMNVQPQEIRARNIEELIEQTDNIHQNMGLQAAQNQCGFCREPIARNTTVRIVIGENNQQNN